MIDPTIVLRAQPPQIPNPLEQYGQMLSLKNLMTQGAMQNQAMQENQLKLQAMKQDMQDQETARQIMGKYQTIDQALPELQQALGPVKAAPIAKQVMEGKQTLANLNETQAKTARESLKLFSEGIDDIMSLPPEKRDAAYQAKVGSFIQSGVVTKDMAANFPATWDDDLMSGYGNHLKQTMADLDVKTKQAALQPKPTGDYQEFLQSYYPGWLEEKNVPKSALNERKAYQEWKQIRPSKLLTPEEEAQEIRLRKASKDTLGDLGTPAYPGMAPGAPAQRNEQFLQTLDPARQAIVKAIVEGRYEMPKGFVMKSEWGQKLLNDVANYEPGFDTSQWRVRLDTRVDFAKGKSAQNVRSLNTLVDHLGKLTDAIKSLDNSKMPIWNAVTNWTAEQTGDPRMTKFRTAAQAVESEAVTVFKGTGATDQEIKEMRSNFKVNAAPAQQLEAAKTVMGLAFGRLSALKSQWDNAFRGAADFQFLNPSSRTVLKTKLGIDPDTIEGAGQAEQPSPVVAAPVKPKSDPLGLF